MNTYEISLFKKLKNSPNGILVFPLVDLNKCTKKFISVMVKYNILRKINAQIMCYECNKLCYKNVMWNDNSKSSYIVCTDNDETLFPLPHTESELKEWQMSLHTVYDILYRKTAILRTALQNLPLDWNLVFNVKNDDLEVNIGYILDIFLDRLRSKKILAVNYQNPSNTTFIDENDIASYTPDSYKFFMVDTDGKWLGEYDSKNLIC